MKSEAGRSGFGNLLESHAWQFLALILVAAAVIRGIGLAQLADTIYFGWQHADERLYHDWAVRLVAGTYNPATVYEFAPLPVYLLAFLYKILSPDLLWFRLFNLVLSVATCGLMYLTAAKVFSRPVGLLTALLAALYEPFVFYSIVPLKTSLSVFLFAAAMWLFVWSTDGRRSAAKLFFLGIVAGLLLNTRANTGVLLPVMPLAAAWLLWKRGSSRQAVVLGLVFYVIGAVVAAGPFVLHNYRASGRLTLTTSQTGRNLFYVNNPGNHTPYYLPVPFARSEPEVQAVQFTIEASRRAGRKLSPDEASAFWTAETWNWIKNNPGDFARKQAWKILALFNHYETGDHYQIGFMANYVPLFRLPFPWFGLLLPLGMAGLVVTWRRSPLARPLVLFGLLYALTLVAFWVNARYRLPVMVVLIPAAAAGLVHVYESRRNDRRSVVVFGTVAVLMLVLEFVPVPGAGDMTAYYNTHAFILNNRGQKEQAAQYWKHSDELDGTYSDYARLSLAWQEALRGDARAALAWLDRVPDDSIVASVKYRVLGDIMAALDQPEQAVENYRKSLEINAGDLEPRRSLIEVLEKLGDPSVEVERRGLLFVESFSR